MSWYVVAFLRGGTGVMEHDPDETWPPWAAPLTGPKTTESEARAHLPAIQDLSFPAPRKVREFHKTQTRQGVPA